MKEYDIENTENDILEKGIETHCEKLEYRHQLNDIAKGYAEQAMVEKKDLINAKKYLYTKGNGWGEDCLDKSKEKVDRPDKISSAFRKLVDIIQTMDNVGMLNELNEYIDAAKARGITISVDYQNELSKETKQIIDDGMKAMDSYQKDMYAKEDYINNELASEAESTNFSPKNKFKKIVELAYKKRDGKDVDDKIQDEYVNIELYTQALEKVNDL